MTKKISSGVVHKIPSDLKKLLLDFPKALVTWEDISPLARNEWICFVEDAKLLPTRLRRIERACTDLMQGKRRPCCWAGCPHRKK